MIFGRKKKKKRTEKEYQTRASRIRVTSLHGIAFLTVDPDPGVPLELFNLSVSGIGLKKGGWKLCPPVGKKLVGDLVIRGSRYRCNLTVVHFDNEAVGCQFGGDMEEMTTFIRNAFHLEIKASNMVEVNPKILKAEEDGRPRWFRGVEDIELFFVEDDKGVIRFHMTFVDQYIEGGRGIDLKCGKVVRESDFDKPKYQGSTLIQYYSQLTEDVTDLAKRFLDNIEGLSSERKEEIQLILDKK